MMGRGEGVGDQMWWVIRCGGCEDVVGVKIGLGLGLSFGRERSWVYYDDCGLQDMNSL